MSDKEPSLLKNGVEFYEEIGRAATKRRDLRQFWLTVIATAVASAITTLALALVLILVLGDDLQRRIDRNAEVTRSAAAATLCILLIDPDVRVKANLSECVRKAADVRQLLKNVPP